MTSCPPQIAELMTQGISWESFLKFDGHGEPSYNAPVTLKCWVEAARLQDMGGGISADRTSVDTTAIPTWDLFFSGDDTNAQAIQLYDRFTFIGVGETSAQKLQATKVGQSFGPPFDNTNPWLIIVTVSPKP